MISSNNPFYYGGLVTGIHFCDRQDEMQMIKQDLSNGLNLLIYAPRRFGKTSLIHNALIDINQPTVFLDLMTITDEKDFINQYFNALAKNLHSGTDKILSFIKQVLTIRPNISIGVNQAGEPDYSIQFAPSEQARLLNEVLNIPLQYVEKKGRQVIVVFDEFQEIVKLGLENKLRSVIQTHGNRVSYLFSGSKKSIMKQIFYNTQNAFYKSVKHVPVKPIENEHWHEYITSGFQKYGKTISSDQIEMILGITSGFPYYTQQIVYEIFNLSDRICEDETISVAVAGILEREENLFLLEWENLSINQKKALKLIIKAQGRSMYRKEIMDMQGLTNSTLKKAIDGLLAKDVIDIVNGQYYFQDPLFEYYLESR